MELQGHKGLSVLKARKGLRAQPVFKALLEFKVQLVHRARQEPQGLLERRVLLDYKDRLAPKEIRVQLDHKAQPEMMV
jgi:hypothetical protein